jgi:hypothetical protein
MSTTHSLLVLRCGDAWEFSGPLNDTSGNPLNLTGATLTWKLDSIDFSTNIVTLVSGLGIEVTNLAQALVAYGPTKEQTAAITPGTYYDTLSISFPDGQTNFTLVEGIINASPIPA